MRRADQVRCAEQDVLRRRLVDEHVDTGTAHLAALQRRAQRRLVDQSAAGAVDQDDALAHLRDRRRVDDVAGLLGQRRVQRDHIGPRQQRVQVDLLDAQVDGPLVRQERIERHHPHLQADGAVGDDGADIAAADQAEGLGGDLGAHEAGLLPLAGLGGGVGGGDLPGDREHHRDGVLGRGDGVAEGRVHHDDALGGGRRNVDIVDADAGTTDHLEAVGGLEQLGRHLGGRADRKAVIVADGGEQRVLILAQIRAVVDLDAARAENLDSGFGQLVGNQNPGGHWLVSLACRSASPCEGIRKRGSRSCLCLSCGKEAQAALPGACS